MHSASSVLDDQPDPAVSYRKKRHAECLSSQGQERKAAKPKPFLLLCLLCFHLSASFPIRKDFPGHFLLPEAVLRMKVRRMPAGSDIFAVYVQHQRRFHDLLRIYLLPAGSHAGV